MPEVVGDVALLFRSAVGDRPRETSDAADESVSQDFRSCVKLFSVVFEGPQWSHFSSVEGAARVPVGILRPSDTEEPRQFSASARVSRDETPVVQHGMHTRPRA